MVQPQIQRRFARPTPAPTPTPTISEPIKREDNVQQIEENLKFLREQKAKAQRLAKTLIPERRVGMMVQQQQAIQMVKAGKEALVQISEQQKEQEVAKKQIVEQRAKIAAQKAQQAEFAQALSLVRRKGAAARFIAKGSEIADEVNQILGGKTQYDQSGLIAFEKGDLKTTVVQAQERAEQAELIKELAGITGTAFTPAQEAEATRKFANLQKQITDVQSGKLTIETFMETKSPQQLDVLKKFGVIKEQPKFFELEGGAVVSEGILTGLQRRTTDEGVLLSFEPTTTKEPVDTATEKIYTRNQIIQKLKNEGIIEVKGFKIFDKRTGREITSEQAVDIFGQQVVQEILLNVQKDKELGKDSEIFGKETLTSLITFPSTILSQLISGSPKLLKLPPRSEAQEMIDEFLLGKVEDRPAKLFEAVFTGDKEGVIIPDEGVIFAGFDVIKGLVIPPIKAFKEELKGGFAWYRDVEFAPEVESVLGEKFVSRDPVMSIPQIQLFGKQGRTVTGVTGGALTELIGETPFEIGLDVAGISLFTQIPKFARIGLSGVFGVIGTIQALDEDLTAEERVAGGLIAGLGVFGAFQEAAPFVKGIFARRGRTTITGATFFDATIDDSIRLADDALKLGFADLEAERIITRAGGDIFLIPAGGQKKFFGERFFPRLKGDIPEIIKYVEPDIKLKTDFELPKTRGKTAEILRALRGGDEVITGSFAQEVQIGRGKGLGGKFFQRDLDILSLDRGATIKKLSKIKGLEFRERFKSIEVFDKRTGKQVADLVKLEIGEGGFAEAFPFVELDGLRIVDIRGRLGGKLSALQQKAVGKVARKSVIDIRDITSGKLDIGSEVTGAFQKSFEEQVMLGGKKAKIGVSAIDFFKALVGDEDILLKKEFFGTQSPIDKPFLIRESRLQLEDFFKFPPKDTRISFSPLSQKRQAILLEEFISTGDVPQSKLLKLARLADEGDERAAAELISISKNLKDVKGEFTISVQRIGELEVRINPEDVIIRKVSKERAIRVKGQAVEVIEAELAKKPEIDTSIAKISKELGKKELIDFPEPKIVEVPRGDKRLKGYIGLTDYDKNLIFISKDLPTLQKATTIQHELGHFKLRKLGIDEFDPTIVKELQKGNLYKSYLAEIKSGKSKYRIEKIPEEIFASVYGEFKSGQTPRLTFDKVFKSRYPKTHKRFSELIFAKDQKIGLKDINKDVGGFSKRTKELLAESREKGFKEISEAGQEEIISRLSKETGFDVRRAIRPEVFVSPSGLAGTVLGDRALIRELTKGSLSPEARAGRREDVRRAVDLEARRIIRPETRRGVPEDIRRIISLETRPIPRPPARPPVRPPVPTEKRPPLRPVRLPEFPPEKPTKLLPPPIAALLGREAPIKEQQGYHAFVKEIKGKEFKRISKKALTKEDASDLMAFSIDHSVARSGYIKPTKQKPKPLGLDIPNAYAELNQEKFRPFKIKKGVKIPIGGVIENKPFVGDTQGEIDQLSAFKRVAQLKKRKEIMDIDLIDIDIGTSSRGKKKKKSRSSLDLIKNL